MRLLAVCVAFLAMTGIARAGVCDSPAYTHASAVVNIGAAATTKIIDAANSSTSKTYVCGFFATLAGTTPTIQLLYGTHTSADCDTGATNLSGAMAPTSGSVVVAGDGGDLFVVPGNQQICGTTTGTGSSFQGIMTYVRR